MLLPSFNKAIKLIGYYISFIVNGITSLALKVSLSQQRLTWEIIFQKVQFFPPWVTQF